MVNISTGGRYADYLLKSDEFNRLPVDVVQEGSTAYLVDTKVMYIFYNGVWYEV